MVKIREVDRDDWKSVVRLGERLTIGVAPWRDPDAVLRAVQGWMYESAAVGFDGVALVAENEGGVVGFISVSTSRHFAGETDSYIGELVVDADHEGRGIGAALVAAAEKVAQDRGHRCLTLSTGAANRKAIGFYERLGFEAEDVKLTKVLHDVQLS